MYSLPLKVLASKTFEFETVNIRQQIGISDVIS